MPYEFPTGLLSTLSLREQCIDRAGHTLHVFLMAALATTAVKASSASGAVRASPFLVYP